VNGICNKSSFGSCLQGSLGANPEEDFREGEEQKHLICPQPGRIRGDLVRNNTNIKDRLKKERERAENENEKERDLLQPVGAPLVNDPAEVNAVLADRDVAQPRGSRIGLVNETQVTKQPAEGR